MRCTIAVAVALAAAGLNPAPAQQPDATELIRESIQNYQKSWRAGMKWTYTQTDVTCADGRKDVEVSRIFPLDGTPYQRVMTKNGQALPPEDQRKEEEKYQQELRRRQGESPEERQARIRKYEEQRNFLADVPNAYSFKLLGEDVINGRPAWVVEMDPRPGFEPATPHGALLKHIEGKLWIDKRDLQWAKAEANVVSTVSIGLILARIGPGAHITLNLQPIDDALWVPKQITINGTARVLLVHNKMLDENLQFTGYHLPSGKSETQLAAR